MSNKAKLIFLFFFLFFSCNEAPIETNLLLYVDYLNIPEDMVLASFNTDKIEIRVRAGAKQIKELNNKDARYTVDIYTDIESDPVGASDSIEPGSYLIPIYKRRLPMNRSIEILSIKPYYLNVKLEKKVSKSFFVKIFYTGTPAHGYMVSDALVEPAIIKLTGPASHINSISELHTKVVDLSNAAENFKIKVPLDLEGLAITAFPDSVVTADIKLEQQQIIKSIENIPVQVLGSSSKLKQIKIDPPEISIKIRGYYEIINNKEVLDKIEAYVDIKDIKPGVHERYVSINIPPGLIMTDASPLRFQFTVMP